MKQPTDKLMINLGHNNPPVTIKSIEFTNSAIEKLKKELSLIVKLKKIFIELKNSYSKKMAIGISSSTLKYSKNL